MIRWLAIALIAFGGWQWWGHREIQRPPGVVAARRGSWPQPGEFVATCTWQGPRREARPNMRVQRTRSSASPLRSPLTRRTLGRMEVLFV